MTKQFVVVAYDIPDDRRRVRLHKVLLGYGTPVQYSVFECLVDRDELARMKRAVRRAIRPRLDHVRYYFLCGACQRRIEVTAGRETSEETEAIVV
jgi:CRISPR-associated protein Cas2